MKSILFILFLVAANSIMAQSLKVITYNIRFNNPADGLNAWPNRSKNVCALIDFHQAEIIGLQEALIGQIEDIKAQFPNMEWVGVGREDGRKEGEFSPIFYNSKKFNALKKGCFWLSETPDKPSIGWDAAIKRVCTWVWLQDDKGKHPFMVFNTHFDHMGTKARAESAKLILRKIKELNKDGLPVILTGDFNLTPEQAPIVSIAKVLKDSHEISKNPCYGPAGTFNGFDWNSPLKDRIDYIFVSDDIEVKRYAILSDSKNQRYPSDHLPVFVSLEVKTPKKK